MLTEEAARELLAPFELALTPAQINQILTYLDLLLRWNRRINLTAIRSPEECVTRHFGESLYLSRSMELHGKLLDIGSGAGFPGLALKIAFPALSVTLLEPVTKKRAFLKEVARVCGMNCVEARGERLEDFAGIEPTPCYDSVTARAVGRWNELISLAADCLKPGGQIFLWLSKKQAPGLGEGEGRIDWGKAIPIPLSRQGEIWCGVKNG
jgi:16S rRNA (guanine527-N7)-methyltransferase